MRLLCSIFVLFTASLASACPKIGSMVDYNCDQRAKIVFTGDSIVYGRGDLSRGNSGGFVSNLDQRYPDANIVNMGIPGITSVRLLRGFKKNLTKKETGTTKIKSRNTDVFVIMVGVNDWWDRRPPSVVVQNIRRLVKFLRSELSKTGEEPFVVVSTLIPTTRSYQKSYVDQINSILLKQRNKNLPVYARGDRLDQRFIDQSGVHPSTSGHKVLARIMNKFLVDTVPKLIAPFRPDDDVDGIYDYFETKSFGTNPRLFDTDGDGFSDGEEIFELGSDPLDPNDPISGGLFSKFSHIDFET